MTSHLVGENELLLQFFQTRDRAIRDDLLERYEGFARAMANRYQGKGEPSDDLVQVAYLGLMNAIDRFDPTLGKPFLAFAAPTVLGELRRHLRDKVWAIRLPRGLQDRTRQVELAVEELSSELGHPPTVDDVGAALDLKQEEVLEAFEAASQRRVGSLDAPIVTDGDGSDSLITRVTNGDGDFDRVDDLLTLRELLPLLTKDELAVLRMRFADELTQSEIAARIGHSQMHVSRMLRNILSRLRTAYVESVEELAQPDQA